jgi:hypothetical protein
MGREASPDKRGNGDRGSKGAREQGSKESKESKGAMRRWSNQAMNDRAEWKLVKWHRGELHRHRHRHQQHQQHQQHQHQQYHQQVPPPINYTSKCQHRSTADTYTTPPSSGSLTLRASTPIRARLESQSSRSRVALESQSSRARVALTLPESATAFAFAANSAAPGTGDVLWPVTRFQ